MKKGHGQMTDVKIRISWSLWVISCLVLIFFVSTSLAEISETEIVQTTEKPIVIEGLSLGMDIEDARIRCEVILGSDWIITPVDNTPKVLWNYREGMGDERIFGTQRLGLQPIVGNRGFAIRQKKDGYYAGFISDHDATGKVTQITFSGRLTDYIFDTKGLHADYFVEKFTKIYDLPDLYWIFHGWTYTSPLGYKLTIRTDKFIDIKKI